MASITKLNLEDRVEHTKLPFGWNDIKKGLGYILLGGNTMLSPALAACGGGNNDSPTRPSPGGSAALAITEYIPSQPLPFGTTSANLGNNTNKMAQCSADTADVPYENMAIVLSTSPAMQHRTLLTGLQSGMSQPYFIACVTPDRAEEARGQTVVKVLSATQNNYVNMSSAITDLLSNGAISSGTLVLHNANSETANSVERDVTLALSGGRVTLNNSHGVKAGNYQFTLSSSGYAERTGRANVSSSGLRYDLEDGRTAELNLIPNGEALDFYNTWGISGGRNPRFGGDLTVILYDESVYRVNDGVLFDRTEQDMNQNNESLYDRLVKAGILNLIPFRVTYVKESNPQGQRIPNPSEVVDDTSIYVPVSNLNDVTAISLSTWNNSRRVRQMLNDNPQFPLTMSNFTEDGLESLGFLNGAGPAGIIADGFNNRVTDAANGAITIKYFRALSNGSPTHRN
jgi:hypothetical protein